MKRIPCALVAACITVWQIQAAVPTNIEESDFVSPNEANNLPDEAKIKSRISTMRSPVRAGYDVDVKAYLNRYLTYGVRETEAILGRGMVYLPIIEHYLDMSGLPVQLKYLPMVESELLPQAVSTKGAAGLWQLAPATACSLGLVIDGKIDERKDANRSTEAAVKYLKRLEKRYGNWELALVAYNCGPGRLNRAIQQAGCDDYQHVKLYLPKETQLYLAKYIAAAYIATYSHYHNIAPSLPDLALFNAIAAKVYGRISLQKVAETTGVDLYTLRRLNPSYKSDDLPARKDGTFLTLPKSAWEPYLKSLHHQAPRP